ncbi:MAG: sigma 54-interacting transcriptional regulator [Planctomycetes bacterium]|nr:sigma 54-interacting transcriptional regulator [Planctomycetota bacterium]
MAASPYTLFPPCPGLSGPGQATSCVRLDLLVRLARFLSDESAAAPALAQMLRWLDRDQGFARGVVALLNDTEDEIAAYVAADAVPRAAGERMRYRPGEGVTGRVIVTNTPVYLAGIRPEDGFLDRSGLRQGLDLSRIAFYCVPIPYRGKPVGTLSADRHLAEVTDPDGDLRLLSEVAHLVGPFVQRQRLEERLDAFQRVHAVASGRMIGRSPAMEAVQRLAAKVAGVDTSVLVTGETGTGKGVLAQLIHELSPRHGGQCIEVNCGAIPDTLIESELFGHEKGAFTGATARRAGVFERAAGGTVFLDEIGELPPGAQTRLLRVLQVRRFERVGGADTLNADVRIIAATNRDLEKEIVAGRFRSDLFYRLNVFPIHMPPLRERGKADIMLLADSFAEAFGKRMGKPIARIDTPAIDMLTSYHWPGNVRELENVIERAVVMAEGDVIHGHHLPPSLQLNRYAVRAPAEEGGAFESRVANFEIGLITEALKDTGGNQTQAAKRLGITKRIMQYKVKLYGIDVGRMR